VNIGVEIVMGGSIGFCNLLNAQNVSNVKQVEVYTAPSHLAVDVAVAKFKKYKSSGGDQIFAKKIQARAETLLPASPNSI
jgi:hypothetical protein